MSHETFWFRGHGIEGFTHVEENHDPCQHYGQSSPCLFGIAAILKVLL